MKISSLSLGPSGQASLQWRPSELTQTVTPVGSQSGEVGGIAALVPGVSLWPLGQTDGRVRVLALPAVHLLAGWSAGL